MNRIKKIRVTGAEALLRTLIEEGVDTVFGYPGGTIMPLYDKLYDMRETIDHILVRHEQGAVHAAQGFARATGKVGVCLATSGPGATNTVTGIADAAIDSTPIVCITAQVPYDNLGTDYFQEADIISITIPITKWSYQITRADEIAEVAAKAFHIARSGRPGPVLLSLTKNAQLEMTDYHYKPYRHPGPAPQGHCGLSEAVGEAASLLNNARRPLIIFGQGVTISGAEEQLVGVAEKGKIPMASTLMGISAVPTGHPLLAGNVGMHGHLAPNRMTQQSDVILAVGMRFSDRVTGDTARYAPHAKIIHLDIDRAEIGKNVHAHVALCGDAREILGELASHLVRAERPQWFGFMQRAKEEERAAVTGAPPEGARSSLSMAAAVDAIARVGGGEAVIVTDVGQQQMFAARYSRLNTPRSFITSGGLGTMGFGLPAAMGAKVGVPGRPVVVIMGDGGFQMSLQELGTIMQSGIGVKMVVLNNSFLGMVRQWQELFFGRRYSCTEMANPDFPALVSAYGIPARRVEEYDELDGAVKEMLDSDGPYFLEVVVQREENVFPMVPAGASLSDIMLSKSEAAKG